MHERGAQALRPHRGPQVMTLGLLSLLCNTAGAFLLVPLLVAPALGVWALLIAKQDLPRMERGEMDAGGHGWTVTGRGLAHASFVASLLWTAFLAWTTIAVVPQRG